MRKNLLILLVTIGSLSLFPSFCRAECMDDPIDLGYCDTLHVIPSRSMDYCSGDTFPYFLRVELFVTHDSNTFWWEDGNRWVQDSIAAVSIPLYWTHTNPTAYCSLISYHSHWSTGLSAFVVSNDSSWYYYNYSGNWPHFYVDSVFVPPHFWMAKVERGESQRWPEGNRVLLADFDFKIQDTMHIFIDTTFWPPELSLQFVRYDAYEYVPRDNLPLCIWVGGVVANFSAQPDSGFAPLEVQFIDLSSGNSTSWLWNFGDGDTDTLQNPIHTYNDTGFFDVTLIVSNSVSSDTMIKPNYIAVFETLTVDFAGQPTQGRKPLNVSFHNLCRPIPESATWYFGDGDSSHLLNPVHQYTQVGSYDVKLVAELFGYKDSLTKEDYIRVSYIKAEFASNKRCGSIPLDVTFSDSSTSSYAITNWRWDFGDGDTSNQRNPTHQYTSSRVFDVRLIVSDSIGADTLTKKGYITTQDSVSADFFGLPNSGRLPLTVMFEPVLEGIANYYLWDFGDGDTSTLRNPIHIYTSQGKYDVKLKVTLELDDCNQVDSTIKEEYVIVNDLQAQFSANPTAGVRPLMVQFTDSSSGNPETWFWRFGDENTSTQQHPQHQYDTVGVYDVFLRVSNSLGSDSLLKLDYILVTDSLYADLLAEIGDVGATPGFDLWFFCAWTNIGTNPAQNCTLKILPPPEMTFYNVSRGFIRTGTYSGYTLSGDTIIIPLQTINPSVRYGGYVRVYGYLPETVPIGDTLVCEAWLTSPTSEQNYANNHVVHLLIVTGSIDPNDKLAYPEGVGSSHDIEPDQWLEYTVRFENKPEATAEAIYIRVVDTLDTDLDWGTLAIGASSHPEKCDYEFDPYTGVIVWFCDSIMLPPNQNPPEGEGYFTYSISPKPDLPNGTELTNTAWIRFDYNAWLQAPDEGPVIRTIKYPFIYGDVNGDGKINASDVVYLINYLFIAGPAPVPIEAGDANCDAKISASDVVYLINYLFISGPPPGC